MMFLCLMVAATVFWAGFATGQVFTYEDEALTKVRELISLAESFRDYVKERK
jgi:hypothetical protein